MSSSSPFRRHVTRHVQRRGLVGIRSAEPIRPPSTRRSTSSSWASSPVCLYSRLLHHWAPSPFKPRPNCVLKLHFGRSATSERKRNAVREIQPIFAIPAIRQHMFQLVRPQQDLPLAIYAWTRISCLAHWTIILRKSFAWAFDLEQGRVHSDTLRVKHDVHPPPGEVEFYDEVGA